MSFSDFSSWPRDQEQSFVVYEQRNAESTKKAFTFGAIVGVLFFIVMVGIYVGVAPDSRDLSKDMNMSNLTKKSRTAEPAPTPEAPKAEAPAPAPAETPAEAPAPAAEE